MTIIAPPSHSLCGIWIDSSGTAHVSSQSDGNARIEGENKFQPFAWLARGAGEGVNLEELPGKGRLSRMAHFDKIADYNNLLAARLDKDCYEVIRNLENQYLLQNGYRLYHDMRFTELRRCQFDIETASSGGFSDARKKDDRVLAIGLLFGEKTHYLVLEDYTDVAERDLLLAFNQLLQELDPDVMEGHNCFRFDLDYLRIRCKRLKIPCAWGRFGQQEAIFRNSRIRIAERWIDFPRCDIPGRAVFDTYLMIQIYDLTEREMESYSLKNIAVHLGISSSDNRTYIDGNSIQVQFKEDRAQFLAYLGDDLRETKGVADLLLPTYFAQAQNFPITLQEASLRGTGTKVELLLLEKYYHGRWALPDRTPVRPIEGGYTKSFASGVFKNVFYFDVASLYPSLLIQMNRNPKNDHLGIFIPLLKELRAYRLEYKKKAHEEKDPVLRKEYEARQASFKILINSFYGYLGFDGARFADSDLAAELTAKGRDLLHALIEEFQRRGATVLEADTDGLYVFAQEYSGNPMVLHDLVTTILPEGIDLEYAGSYPAMFCYKAKNYALFNGEYVIVKGSALRSRGMEPFLKELTNCLIHYKLGVSEVSPEVLLEEFTRKIESGTMDVMLLAKRERLSQNPETYAKSIDMGKKPRRASLEVALRMTPMPRMGDRVAYFIAKGEKARQPDWQRAYSVKDFNKETLPYDPTYYLKKLKDWKERYKDYLSSGEE
ncbi:MAG: DNA polymerase [Verrucomicrobia bacterium CG_4_10_14_3_um_filter_43_23]|nr:MAG: DNA polymerase [Verrucomicrobia bacterium CG1_02_43_26]PIP59271.1 MAG: DNA polymerase [Verrucomicrobia bacterium CG22_combo_CG10-13_8_21_14_all_43_17]PIX57927.1 MAG: DNA polymerase [Verrucomicrobia bacterium CG_4_10_14_3_um_filter_43_23]PIY61731.1 MAG: DNA polymerase [Verrucomicrobia bacterium CG_4_10_14_0_8_um_filter_43_34]PJA43434.1 MAG: DNA polymerase [Verrucomicrobia bacterium CG_4_9_14_3_um_filter_43_20]